MRTCPCRLFCFDRRPAVPARLQQTFIDELTPVLERVKFDVAFMHRIVSYHFPLRPYRANTKRADHYIFAL